MALQHRMELFAPDNDGCATFDLASGEVDTSLVHAVGDKLAVSAFHRPVLAVFRGEWESFSVARNLLKFLASEFCLGEAEDVMFVAGVDFNFMAGAEDDAKAILKASPEEANWIICFFCVHSHDAPASFVYLGVRVEAHGWLF